MSTATLNDIERDSPWKKALYPMADRGPQTENLLKKALLNEEFKKTKNEAVSAIPNKAEEKK